MPTVPRKSSRLADSVEGFQQLLVDNLYHSHGQAIQSASMHDAYTALCYTVRDQLIERWRRTTEAHFAANPKFVYYLSAEYLPGKQLAQNLLYSGVTEWIRGALQLFGLRLEDFLAWDLEPGLGNGGLGRLAACFCDSLATLDIPAVAYGIRYEFGIFKQRFENGWQIEFPDAWAAWGNPWEFRQADDAVEIGFGGRTETYQDERGLLRHRWVPAQRVLGEPCTNLVPGYGTGTVNILRLWRARATAEFDLERFDRGDYFNAVEQKVVSENLSKVLYPNDMTPQGRELRLKQQYFFVACSLRDIIRRFRLKNSGWGTFPHKVAIQLNDTHPVIAIPELMRILVDEERVGWEEAWELTRHTFAYTCHTLLPEALEKWPVDLLGRLLPRHLEILYEINHRFLERVRTRFPSDRTRLERMSLVEEGPVRQVRMAHLAVVGSFAVNGVAELHSRLLREQTLSDFAELWPDRFQNKTNGVSPRRFLQIANPRLAGLITQAIGDSWLRDLEQLAGLVPLADDPEFQEQWRQIKLQNKQDLAVFLQETSGVPVDPQSMFVILAKRLHEYKRQLLKAMHLVWLYRRIQADPLFDVVPRTFLFAAKAAPGYAMAKRIIKLIHGIADVVNHDPRTAGRIRVVFPENFNVSLAERLYPAADLSEQISLAGKEASGTGNMKFALNGAVTIGTLDGANIEIRDRVGAENFFLFGLNAEQVLDLKTRGYDPADSLRDPELQGILEALAAGRFTAGDTEVVRPIVSSLRERDEYLLLADFPGYVAECEAAARAYTDRDAWTRMSILNTARCGYFSSDRTIREYCRDIWRVRAVPVE